MQLSSSVIKNKKVIEQGNKEIVTLKKIDKINNLQSFADGSLNYNNPEFESYERIASTIIEKARQTSEEIKATAIAEAETIEREAYNVGYEKGKKQGYAEAYEETVVKGKIEAENLKKLAEQNASNLLRNTNLQCEKHIKDNIEKIKNMAITIASQVLKKSVEHEDGINNMVYDAILQTQKSNIIIIKCNNFHYNAIMNAVGQWKKQIPAKCEMFVVEDNFIEQGTALIEKDNGIVKVGIDVGLEKIIEELKNY